MWVASGFKIIPIHMYLFVRRIIKSTWSYEMPNRVLSAFWKKFTVRINFTDNLQHQYFPQRLKSIFCISHFPNSYIRKLIRTRLGTFSVKTFINFRLRHVRDMYFLYHRPVYISAPSFRGWFNRFTKFTEVFAVRNYHILCSDYVLHISKFGGPPAQRKWRIRGPFQFVFQFASN